MMNKENIKMVVTDLDKTLLKDDKTISNYSLNIIDEFRKKGNIFVIATARPIRTVKKYMHITGFDAGIYHNGALIYDKNIKIGGYGIENPYIVSKKILDEISNTCLAIEVEDILYANFNSKYLWPDNEYIHFNDFIELEEKVADKIIVEVSSMDDVLIYKKILPDELYIQLSENKIGMIMNKNATKINGIKMLSKIYKVDMSNIISFGDDGVANWIKYNLLVKE